MSIHLASKIWRTELGGGTLKAVAMKLADCAEDDGTNVWPSVKRIARETEASERSVQYALKELIAKGILIVVEMGGRGPKSTTEYRFNMPLVLKLNAETEAKWAAEDEKEGAKSAPKRKRSKGAKSAAKGAKSAAKGARVAPDPSLDPSLPVKDTPVVPSGDDAVLAFSLWNDLAQRTGLPRANKLTEDRRRKLKARLVDYGLDGWKQALENVPRSKFLMGREGERNWRCTLEFLLKPGSFSKVFDGGFNTPTKYGLVDPAKVVGSFAKPAAETPWGPEASIFREGSPEFAAALAAADPRTAAAIRERKWVKCKPLTRVS